MESLLFYTANAFLSFAKAIYPIQEPNFKRDRPLEVLCLGLSRSGTDSLSKALVRLGYDETYHGMQVVSHRMSDAPQWYRLVKAKLVGKKAFLCAEEFDKLIGHCMAVTDAPCCLFSEDLIRCYPNAKVVLNRRRDVKAWEESVKTNLFGMYASWIKHFKTYFQTDLFWIRLWGWSLLEPLMTTPWEQNTEKMGEMYEKHYDEIKNICRNEGREYLEWTVEDGWDPLCKFLGKAVPDEPFPRGNSTADFQEFKSKVQDPRLRKAERNMILTAAVTLGALVAAVAYYQKP